ncbi:MAG: zinc-dependent alcohol dehydrogenase family protein [Rubrobacter sp.]|nr:zinc-dependent alcohol dehydrogenase family protein [Rubrobacter sp.]
MRAQVVENFGGPEVFQERDVPKPETEAGHVLIRVEATSVNPVDYKLRGGSIPGVTPASPTVLHGDVAGVVEEVGEGVSGFSVGDEVYGCAGGFAGMPGGALAEYLLADADLLAHKPASLTMREAAALPLVAITAWEALISRARVSPGENVLVHGATGGVGHVAIQLASAAGAQVFTTGSSEEKLKLARDLGANAGINYREQSVEDYVSEHTGGRGFDLVFDTVGDENLVRSFEAVRPEGQVASIVTHETYDLSPLHDKSLSLHVVLMLIPLVSGEGRARHGQILSRITRMVEAGRLRPLVDEERFGLFDAADDHHRQESGEAVGKVTLARD